MLKFRAFIAIDIEPNEDMVGLLRELAFCRADLKIVKPELLHVTLKFLGDTDDGLVDQITERIRLISEGVEPFRIRLVGMGAFPSMSNIRVVWVGIEDGSILQLLASNLERSLEGLGFERERKGFKPHLTIARARSGRNIAAVQDLLRKNATRDYGTYEASSILLKRSVLTPQGPSYSTVAEIPLRRESQS